MVVELRKAELKEFTFRQALTYRRYIVMRREQTQLKEMLPQPWNSDISYIRIESQSIGICGIVPRPGGFIHI